MTRNTYKVLSIVFLRMAVFYLLGASPPLQKTVVVGIAFQNEWLVYRFIQQEIFECHLSLMLIKTIYGLAAEV